MSLSSRSSRFRACVWIALAAGLAGCGSDASETARLRVFAASSLTDAVGALAAGYERAPVEASFGGSSTLARQIRDGAPADVFLSASGEWVDFLVEAGLVEGEPVVFAGNRLVCIAKAGSPLARVGLAGPRALLGALDEGERVAIADRGVPAGEYARRALDGVGLLDDFRGRFAGQRDARAVLHAVERGELPVGFVYATDAEVADVVTLFAFDPVRYPAIEYRAAVVRGARDPVEAGRFVSYLTGVSAQRRLGLAGFLPP